MSKDWCFRVGTRGSNLALKQVKEIEDKLKSFYPKIKLEIVPIETYGDKDKLTPISDIEGTDFFTREIDEALLNGEIDPSTSLRVNGERVPIKIGTSRTIDFAVHSAKDLPDEIPQGLIIAAITKSIDPYDALVSISNGIKIDELKRGAKIGASSWRRKNQLKKYRADFQVIDIRGTIEERLEKLDLSAEVPTTVGTKADRLDAIVVAACALIRLGLEDRIAQRIPFEILKPHPLQGALAIQAKESSKEIIDLLKILNGK